MKYEMKPLTEEEEVLIEKKISEYADSMAPSEPHTKEEKLVFKITDEENNVVGGCVVNIHAWGRAVLAQLWVDEQYRLRGLGSMLIRAAENAAREKGCYYLCLGTLDFMARPLYEKHGFKVFTVNHDLPRGHTGWSMSKRLDQGLPDCVPANNSAGERFKVEPGGREEARIIDEGLGRFCDQFIAPDESDDIPLNKKLVDKDGNLIAAVLAEVDADKSTDLNGVWVEEPYRNRGIGSCLLGVIDREAKENGSYLLISNACDWNIGFFKKCGYTVRGELPDYPRGHTAYETEKRI
ncbi:MAG: GNAT family N-acetyltransferase [Clostridia bacterium]|nr:GNAT family N-acetyltransferase [Clostridia bacterium]